MTHSAYVLARSGAKSWRGGELDLHEVEDLDELADMMRDFADSDLTVVFIEEDDEYVAIARVDGEDDPRGFVSDARCLEASSTVAAKIFEGALEMPTIFELVDEDDDEDDAGQADDEDESEAPEIEPAGDPKVLSDLGVSESDLLGLCSAEGNLPADVISAICERIGALEELERVRGL